MKLFTLAVLSASIGVLLSALSSMLFNYYSKRRLSREERLRIASLDSLDDLLRRAKRHHSLTQPELQQIWSDAMNYIMTARSPRAAANYLSYLESALGPDAEPFASEARKILADRFDRSECELKEAPKEARHATLS